MSTAKTCNRSFEKIKSKKVYLEINQIYSSPTWYFKSCNDWIRLPLNQMDCTVDDSVAFYGVLKSIRRLLKLLSAVKIKNVNWI
jgi:hypothetical protein